MSEDRSRRNRKIGALTAGAAIVAVGATYTLASWNDSEWVWAGLDESPGIGTSSFNVQQNTTPGAAGEFQDFETNPGGGLQFSAGALSLGPGHTVYAPVALRTAADSTAGSVTLRGAVRASGIAADDEGDLLWEAITVDVYTTANETQPECNDALDPSAWEHLVMGAGLDDGATEPQALGAEGGSVQHYCFALTLDAPPEATDLMGRTIAPAWEFAAESAG